MNLRFIAVSAVLFLCSGVALGRGLSGPRVQLPGWGYTAAPGVTAPPCSLPRNATASVLDHIQTRPVNLAQQPVTANASAASTPASYAGSVPQTLSDKWSDTYNILDLGAALTGSVTDKQAIVTAFTTNSTARVIEIPAGRWPDGSWYPASVGATSFVHISGGLQNRPAYNMTSHGLGVGVPYFGDGVASEMHGDAGDGANVAYSRVDSHGTAARDFAPIVSSTLLSDTPNEPGNAGIGGQQNVKFTTIRTDKTAGFSSNQTDWLYDMGMGYWSGQAVNRWSHTNVYGTDWAWDNLQEMYDFVPFLCPNSADHTLCSAKYMNEEDMSGVGPEQAATAYDPTAAIRKMFWLTTNHNINSTSSTDLHWTASKSYTRYQIITVIDSSGNEWMFSALPTSYVLGRGNNAITAISGTATPSWAFTKGATVADGGITWTCLGTWQYDLGAVFAIGGDNQSGHVERIGTLMEEETDEIYNAIFDMSKAQFYPNIPTHVFARLQPDMYLDLSANGTAAGQNNHLLGYSSATGGLNYVVKGTSLASIADDGTYSALGRLSVATGGQANMSAITKVSQTGLTVGTNKYAVNDTVLASGQGGMSLYAPATDGTLPGAPNVFIRSDHTVMNTPLQLQAVTTFAGLSQDNGYMVNRIDTGFPYIFEAGSWRPIVMADPSGNIGTTGYITGNNGILLPNMTKSAVLALPSPREGQKVYDTDDHVEITYRCPTTTTCAWFPTQYGPPIGN